MKLLFIIDKKYDLQFVQDERGELELCEAYGRDEEALAYTVNEYQKSWDKINDHFSDFIEAVTEQGWTHEKYFCIVSPVHPGISNWDGSDRIIRWWKEHPLLMRRITAHELIIHHFFAIVRRRFEQESISENQIWALAEVAAFALTSLRPEAKAFWPWDTSGYYTEHNYPQIVRLQQALTEPFIKMKKFSEYVHAGIIHVKKFPTIDPDMESPTKTPFVRPQ